MLFRITLVKQYISQSCYNTSYTKSSVNLTQHPTWFNRLALFVPDDF